ncbi:hypothetical protein V4U86_23750 [Mycobacterium sp. AMU20-3851]|uniref:hypothetical protein n=1 Tax=Mycobacterium sp. AMU20-3851 TaxID=3122055 RepID=UPI003754591A
MTDFGDLLADIGGVRRVRHAWLTFSGTWAPPGTGYSSWVVQNADPDLVFEVPAQAPWSFGPVSSPDPNAPSYRQSVAIGKQWAIDWIDAHPHQTFGLGGYSQGAQCAGEVYLELLPGGVLEHRFPDFVGGFSFGDPMRPEAVTGGGTPDPGGAGISPARITVPDPRWHYAANGPANGAPGIDLYTATPLNGAGKIIRTFYSMGVDIGLAPTPLPMVQSIARGVVQLLVDLLGPLGGLGGLAALGPSAGLAGQLLNNPAVAVLPPGAAHGATVVDIIEAAVLALQFIATRTGPHVSYDTTDAVPGVNHIAHTVRHVNALCAGVGARVAA